MNNCAKSSITSLFALLVSITIWGQGLSKPELYKVTHTPPEATSLGKYGEYPVSLYSGVPNIQIPIYQIDHGRIKIPISLSYHAGGIKVEEIAPSVGLGWALGAGGAITRSVRSMPDEQEYVGGWNFYTDPRPVQNMINPPNDVDSVLAYKNYWGRIIQGTVDGEPDSYSFNFGNYSGKFLYHQVDGKFYCAPHTAFRIERDQSTFKITDENGIQYTFESTETSLREAQNAEQVETITTWFLTHIYDPVSTRSVSFTYAAYTITYPVTSSQSHYMPMYGSDQLVSAKQNPFYSLKRLKRIDFEEGYIKFEHNQFRCDLPGDSALTGIKVYNSAGLLIKHYSLDYDYFFTAPYSNISQICNSSTEAVNKRLKLLRVNQLPVDGSSLTPLTHTFAYNETELPSRMSYSQDHWGFYNGKNNTYLFPPAVMNLTSQTVSLPGGDRNIDSNYTQAAMLNRITFPTGGHTNFQYESNRADNPSLPSTLNTRSRSEGGGLGGGPQGEYYFSVSSTSCYQNSNHANGGAYINWEMWGLDLDMIQTLGFPGQSADIKIVNVDSPQHSLQMVTVEASKTVAPTSTTFYLPNGNYKLVADFSQNPFSFTYDATTVVLSWTECIELTDINTIDKLVGGVRIKKITNYYNEDSVASVKSYNYTKESNPSSSSGQTHFFPNYMYRVNKPTQGPFGLSYYTNVFLKRSSYSTYPLLNESGKSVGYSNVIEMDGVNGSNGYTQYKFTNYSDYDDFYNFPGYGVISTPTSYNWLRGLELEKKVYKKENNQYVLVAETLNEYDTALLSGSKKLFKGIIGHWTDDAYLVEPGALDPFTYRFEPAIADYTVFSDFVYLKKTKQRTYQNGTFLEKEINYTYSPKNLMPAVVEALNNNGNKEIVTTKYPLDYNVANPTNSKAQAVLTLQDLNYLSAAIEQSSQIQVGTGSKKLKMALHTSFKPTTPLPDTVFMLTDNSINNYAGINIGSGAYSIHSNYKPEIISEKYGDGHNLLQQKSNNNFSISYIWDYQDSYPICEVKNAANDQVAYTSFEADGWGGWTMNGGSVVLNNGGLTGNKTISGGVNKSVPAGNYVIGVWSIANTWINGQLVSVPHKKILGPWRYFEIPLTNVTYINVAGDNIDEVRLYPQGAQMTTYTYEPLVGMTSQCDIKNNIIYYEYDAFGRLKTIRDQDKNVLKTIDYQYQKNYNQ